MSMWMVECMGETPMLRAERGHLRLGLDRAAGDAGAGVSGGVGHQIVRLGMDDDGLAEDVVRAAHGDVTDGHVDLADAVGVGGDVAEVAGVAVDARGTAVMMSVGVVV